MVRSLKRNKKRKISKLNFFRVMNRFIRNGNKDFVYTSFIRASLKLKKKIGKSFDDIFDKIFIYLRPVMQLKPLFSSGIIYQLPASVNELKEYTMAIQWFYKAILNRSEKNLSLRIEGELVDLHQGKSPSIELKIAYYKQIIENRVYLYRFKRKLRF